MLSATCAHRVAADVRWRLVAQLVLVFIIVVCADAEVTTTITATDATLKETTTGPTPAETTTPSTNTTSSPTAETPVNEAQQTSNSSFLEYQTEKLNESQKETGRSQQPDSVTEAQEVSSSSSTLEVSTAKESEESGTESASELALESVHLAVVIKSPLSKNGTVKASVKNVTDGQFNDDEDEDSSGFEYDGEDDSDDRGLEYYGDDDEGEDRTVPLKPPPSTSTIAPSDEALELSREATTESSSSTTSSPRRPRHSNSGVGERDAVAPAPRQKRPSRAKDERRVLVRTTASGSGSPKKRRTPKERTAKPPSTASPLPAISETKPNYYQVDSTEKPDTTEQPVTPRRTKRRKKKTRRQKQPKPTSPPERQLTAESRAAAESAAAAAAAESLQSELTPAPTASVRTPETDPTVPVSRPVRQDEVSIQQSEVNPDGSYSFSYDTADEGRHSRTEVGSPDNVVSGRYGYIDANSRATFTQYSAGPRGFRAVGPDIARKMDLSQAGPAPRPPPDGRYSPEYDTYSDPNEDPSYSFQYSTDTARRVEKADSRGDVLGRYEFIDDQGEKHVVSYEAGAEKGFHVRSSYPDNVVPAEFFPGRGEVPPRGRAAIMRFPNGAYRFTAVGPDSRREECSSAANYRIGSYTYLDDKSVRRTVYYEAGPNIGFRVLPNPPAAIPRCQTWQGVGPFPPASGSTGSEGGFGAPTPGKRPGSLGGGGSSSDGSTPGPWAGGGLSPGGSTKKPWAGGGLSPGGSTKKPWAGGGLSPGGSTKKPWAGGGPSPGGSTKKPWVGDGSSQSGGSSDPWGDFPTDEPFLIDGSEYPKPTPSVPSSRPRPSLTKPPHRPTTRPPNRPPGTPFATRPTTYKPPIGGITSTAPPDFFDPVPIPKFPLPAPRPGSSNNRGNSAFDNVFNLPTPPPFVVKPQGNDNRHGENGDGGGDDDDGREPQPPSKGGSKGTTPTPGYPKPGPGTGTGSGAGAGAGAAAGTGTGTGTDTGADAGTGEGPDDHKHSVSATRPSPEHGNTDGYRPYTCCGRLHVVSALDDRYGRARPIRTYIQSIDLSDEERGAPGRAENPSVALERFVREQERKTSRRRQERRRRRRRRRSVL